MQAPMRSPCIFIDVFFLGDRDLVRSFSRLCLSMGFSELEFLGQIFSFERRLRGAAPTPLTLPYPFRTSRWTRMEAERDKWEVRKMLYFERYCPFIPRILM